MSELGQQTPLENPRNLDRAEWQRSIGMVAFSQLCDLVLAEKAETPIAQLLDSQPTTENKRIIQNMPAPWSFAYKLSDAYFRSPNNLLPSFFPEQIETDTQKYTFAKTVKDTFIEGLAAQKFFPLNIARIIENDAAKQSISSYEIDDLADITRLFRDPNFHKVLTTCAFTINGMWRVLSTIPYYEDEDKHLRSTGRLGYTWFSFDDGNVSLQAHVTQKLRKKLAANNTAALSGKYEGKQQSLDYRPSSGCPVNHLKPHSSTATDYAGELSQLSDIFGVSVEHLLRPRDRTPIVEMTLAFADCLDKLQAATID